MIETTPVNNDNTPISTRCDQSILNILPIVNTYVIIATTAINSAEINAPLTFDHETVNKLLIYYATSSTS